MPSHSPVSTGLVLIAAAVAIAASLAAFVLTGISHEFDDAVIGVVRDPSLIGALGFLQPLTELGSTWAVTILAFAAFGIGVLIGPWIHGAIAAGVIGLASLGVEIIKEVIARERPELLEPIVTEPGYSFPSGHSALGAVGWGVLAVLVSRTRLPRWLRIGLVIGCVALIGLIGLSRVYLGAHYPTDVIAGWALGFAIVLGYALFTREVSREPAAAAVDADPAGPRSDPPVTR